VRPRWCCGALASVILATGVAAAEERDPFVGIWELDTGLSKYESKDLPQKMVIVMQAAPHGVQYKSETTFAGHRVSSAAYTAEYDGRPAMVTGDAGLMAPVLLKRKDMNTVDAVYVRGLQAIASSHRVISADGAIMTITTSSKTAQGAEIINIGIYHKVREPRSGEP
jgi:hypothetical protein